MKAKAWTIIPHVEKTDAGEVTVINEIRPLTLCEECEHFDKINCCLKNGLIVPNKGVWFCADGEGKR